MSNDKPEKINLDYLKLRIEVLKLMSSLPRLRIILLLIIFRRLSLSKLNRLLGRTKSTITHHLKFLDELGIITTTKENGRGSIDAKVYELVPGFLDKFTFNLDQLISYDLEPEKKKELFHYAVLNDKWIFEAIKSIYEQSILYYDAIDYRNMRKELNKKFEFANQEHVENNTQLQKDLESFEEFQKYHFQTPINYEFWFLSEKGRKKYDELFKKFKSELKGIIEQENKEENEVIRPYLILHSFFPMREIAEYDSEKNEFRKFFEALE
jgi:DNA-binding transcriptional ArsR family regulator